MGVITADLGAGPFSIQSCIGDGDGGRLQSRPIGACTPPGGAFLLDVPGADPDGPRQINYPADMLAETFSCIARVGISGCGFEQPLESIRRALDGSVPDNAGFLRDGAMLALIIASDQDDCSVFDTALFDPDATATLGPLSQFRCFEFGVACAESDPRAPGPRSDCRPRDDSPYLVALDDYASFLHTLKPGPGNVFVAGLVGARTPIVVGEFNDHPELEPSCEGTGGQAQPTVRLSALVDRFGAYGLEIESCADDRGDRIAAMGHRLAELMDARGCLYGDLVDGDENVAGIQPRCDVIDVAENDSGAALLPCDSDATAPCWRVIDDTAACSSSITGLRLQIERTAPSDAVRTVARCAVASR